MLGPVHSCRSTLRRVEVVGERLPVIGESAWWTQTLVKASPW
jgi:hypothetical protein